MFDNDKPKVSQLEFHKNVRSELSNKGFTPEKLDRVEAMFAGSFAGMTDYQKGIDSGEISSTIGSLREHPHAKLFNDHELTTIEEAMRKHL